MHSRAELILAIGIMAVAGYAAISAIAWPLKTALFPLVISLPLFVLALIEAIWVWRSRPALGQTKDFQRPPAEVPSTIAGPRVLRAVGWIFGFFFAIGLFGFLVAVPVFVFLYLKLQSRESWTFSIIFTAVIWGVFYGLFDYTLHLPFGSGLLF